MEHKRMFRELRTTRYLRIGVDDTGLAIGFDERLSRIAQIRQKGLKAPVEPHDISCRIK